MALNVEYIYKVIDKYSGPLDRVKRSTNRATEAIKRAKKASDKFGKSMKNAGKAMLVSVTAPLALVSTFALKAAADLETMQISFDVMLGSAEKGKALMEDLKKFSAKTPFQLEGIAQSTKQLLAAGVAAEDMIDNLTVIGDIAAGANVPITDMAAIFAKSRQKGKLMSEEILQFAERGVPLLDALAKSMGKSKSEIFEMASKGKITFDIAMKSLRAMTSEGGVFNDMMAKQSGTMAGLWSTLKDNIFLAQGSLGQTVIELFNLKGVLSDIIATVGSLNDRFLELAKTNPQLVKMIVIAAGILAALGPVLVILGSLSFLLPVLTAGFALLASPITLVVAAMITAVAIGKKLFDLFWTLGVLVVNVAKLIGPAIGNSIINGLTAAKDYIMSWVSWFSGIFDGIISKIASVKAFIGGGSPANRTAENAASSRQQNVNVTASGSIAVRAAEGTEADTTSIPFNMGTQVAGAR